jgi:hypothetical protein
MTKESGGAPARGGPHGGEGPGPASGERRSPGRWPGSPALGSLLGEIVFGAGVLFLLVFVLLYVFEVPNRNAALVALLLGGFLPLLGLGRFAAGVGDRRPGGPGTRPATGERRDVSVASVLAGVSGGSLFFAAFYALALPDASPQVIRWGVAFSGATFLVLPFFPATCAKVADRLEREEGGPPARLAAILQGIVLAGFSLSLLTGFAYLWHTRLPGLRALSPLLTALEERIPLASVLAAGGLLGAALGAYPGPWLAAGSGRLWPRARVLSGLHVLSALSIGAGVFLAIEVSRTRFPAFGAHPGELARFLTAATLLLVLLLLLLRARVRRMTGVRFPAGLLLVPALLHAAPAGVAFLVGPLWVWGSPLLLRLAGLASLLLLLAGGVELRDRLLRSGLEADSGVPGAFDRAGGG